MSHLVQAPDYRIPFTLRRTFLWTMQTGKVKNNHFLLATLFKNEGKKTVNFFIQPLKLTFSI